MKPAHHLLSPKMGNETATKLSTGDYTTPPAPVEWSWRVEVPSSTRLLVGSTATLSKVRRRIQRPFFGPRRNSLLRTWRAFSTCLKSSQMGWKGDIPYIETFFSSRVLISAIHLRHVIYTLIMIMEAFLWQMTQHPESQPLPDQVEPKESSCIVPGFLLALIQWPMTEICSHIDLGRARSLQFRYLKCLLIDT